MSVTYRPPASIVNAGTVERFLGDARVHRACVLVTLALSIGIVASLLYTVGTAGGGNSIQQLVAPLDSPIAFVRAAEIVMLVLLLVTTATLAAYVIGRRSVYPLSRVVATICAACTVASAAALALQLGAWNSDLEHLLGAILIEPIRPTDPFWRFIAVIPLAATSGLLIGVVLYSLIKFSLYYPCEVPEFTRFNEPPTLKVALENFQTDFQLQRHLHIPFVVTYVGGYALILSAFSNAGMAPQWEFVFRPEIAGYFFALTIFATFAQKHAYASAVDRRPIQWIVYGQASWLLVFVACMLGTLAIQHRLPELLGPADQQILLLQSLLFTLYTGFVLVFILTLAISILYKGTIDPALLLRRTVLIALGGVVSAFVLVVAEQVTTSWVSDWLELGPASTMLLATGIQLICLMPFRGQGSSVATRLVNLILLGTYKTNSTDDAAVVVLVSLRAELPSNRRNAVSSSVLLRHLIVTAERFSSERSARMTPLAGGIVMLRFMSCDAAISVASSLLRCLKDKIASENVPACSVQAAVHLGCVADVLEDGLSATLVDQVARMLRAAGPNEIVLSDLVMAGCSDGYSFEPLGSDGDSAPVRRARYYRLRID